MRSLAGVGGLAAILGVGVSAWHLFKRRREVPIEVLGFRYPGRTSASSHVAMWKTAEATAGTTSTSQDVDVDLDLDLDVNALPLVETRDLTEPLRVLLGKKHGFGFTIDPKSGLGPVVFLALKHCRSVSMSPVFGRTSLYTRVVHHVKHKDVKESDAAPLLRLPPPPPTKDVGDRRPSAAVFMITTRPAAEVLTGEMAAAVQDATSGLAVHSSIPCLEVPASAASSPDAVQHLVDTVYLWLCDVVYPLGSPEEVVVVITCPEIPELASAFGLCMGHVRCDFRQRLAKLTVVTPTDTTSLSLGK